MITFLKSGNRQMVILQLSHIKRYKTQYKNLTRQIHSFTQQGAKFKVET